LGIFVGVVFDKIKESGKVRESDPFCLLLLSFSDAAKES
jgi:hypothetical protein